MTDKLREAAQAALHDLEEIHHGNMTPLAEGVWRKAICGLRAALAEQDQRSERKQRT